MKQVSLQVLNVVMLLQEACNGVQEFSHQEIQRMIGILRTNGMKLEPHGIGMMNVNEGSPTNVEPVCSKCWLFFRMSCTMGQKI